MNNVGLHTGKARYYQKFRPFYSHEAIEYLADRYSLKNKIVADMGSGTGILAQQLSAFSTKILAVEPNADMYKVCMESISDYKNITVIQSTAENSCINDFSVDFITVGTAFHWFNVHDFFVECKRILRHGGGVAVLTNSTGSNNYIDSVKMRKLCDKIDIKFADELYKPLASLRPIYDFFADVHFEFRKFANELCLTREQFIGRYLSMHYAPEEHSKRDLFILGLEEIFDDCSEGSFVHIANATTVFSGILKK